MDEKVLVVDDDAKLRKLLQEYLAGYGLQVICLADGSGVAEKIDRESPDLVILDIMLPGRDGLEVLREIRGRFPVPVIMLTAKGEDEDRIVGLELGADDYLPKPFNPRELLARIKAVMRRAASPEVEDGRGEEFIEAGGLSLDTAKRTLLVAGEEVELSATEFKILEAMMRRPDRVFSRDELLSLARGRDWMAFDRSVDVHISNLRAKLKAHPGQGRRIKTVWGTGYMFLGDR